MSSSRLMLNNATIFDAQATEPRSGQCVLVEGEHIAEVSDRPISASVDRVYDLKGRTLLPGLIDAHAHVYLTETDLTRLAGIPVTLITARAIQAMRQMLDRGFTTVRDAGGADWGIQEAVRLGIVKGPRLFISGRALSQTGGHGDMRARTVGYEPCGCASALQLCMRIADGVPEVQQAVREELRQGANQIKVMVSGGVSSPRDPLRSLQYSAEELRAIVREASAWGTYVLAHAYTSEAITHAVAAGVRSIEHGNLLDQPTAQLMAKNEAFLVPTLVAHESMRRRAKEFNVPQSSLEKLEVVFAAGLESLEIAREAGVRMGFGTDLLGGLQNDQSHEFSIRREVLSSQEIIVSATNTNATLLGRSHDLGLIAPGYFADMIAVDGDPLKDIGLLEHQGKHIDLIMCSGHVHKCKL